MTHYVCTGGCRGVSNIPGACKTEGCKKKTEPLIECHCDDGEHEEAFSKNLPVSSDLAGKPEPSEVKREY